LVVVGAAGLSAAISSTRRWSVEIGTDPRRIHIEPVENPVPAEPVVAPEPEPVKAPEKEPAGV
jgi:hypothetical protein